MIDHILKIKYRKKISLPDANGTFYMCNSTSTIEVQKTKDYKDTLIHELCHFILGIVTGHWQGHSKNFFKLYKVIKSL